MDSDHTVISIRRLKRQSMELATDADVRDTGGSNY